MYDDSSVFNEWEYDAKNNRLSDKEFNNDMSPAHDMSKLSGHKDKDQRVDIDKTSFKHKLEDKPDIDVQTANVTEGLSQGMSKSSNNIPQALAIDGVSPDLEIQGGTIEHVVCSCAIESTPDLSRSERTTLASDEQIKEDADDPECTVETRVPIENVVLSKESAALAATVLHSVIVTTLFLVNIPSLLVLELSLSSFVLLSPLGSNPTLFEETAGTALFRPMPSDSPVGVNFVINVSILEFMFKENLKAHMISKQMMFLNEVIDLSRKI